MTTIPAYAELLCLTNFSFLRGASFPEELVERAHALGYAALAITDECSMAGVVRAHVKAKELGQRLLIGVQFEVRSDAPFRLVALATNLNGYGNLCQLITRLRRSSEKGTYRLDLSDLGPRELDDCVVISVPRRGSSSEQLEDVSHWTLRHFVGRCWLGVELLRQLDDEAWLYRMREASHATAIPLVACGDVHFHVRSRKPLQDVMTATRIGRPLTECGLDLQPNAERHPLRRERSFLQRARTGVPLRSWPAQ